MSSRRIGEATSLWLQWKRSYEIVRARIVAEVTAEADLSEPEVSVLVWLHEAGGSLRQSAIAASLGWDRSRLSHLLTRMEKRQLVTRAKVAGAVVVSFLSAGERTIERLEPVLEVAARRHLLGRLRESEETTLRDIGRRLASPAVASDETMPIEVDSSSSKA
jgi:DNA-binding MarR family transcriptional regulator